MAESKYTPQQIRQLEHLAKETIQMRSDIKVVISVFSKAMKAFGMNELKVSEGASINQMLPDIVRKLTIEFASGTFDTQALANIQEVLPIIEKYKHLASND